MPAALRTPRRTPASRLLAGLVLLGLAGPARGASPPPARGALELRAGGAWLDDTVPPSWESARDRLQVELGARWRPSPVVTLGLDLDAWRADRHVDGRAEQGPGDLRLLTDLRLWRPGAVEGRLAWWAKLPNADDEKELGTDETDLHFGLDLSRPQGPARLRARLGVAVLGDPRRATAQSWLPEGELEAHLRAGPVVPMTRLQATLGSEILPAQATATLGLEGGCPWLWGAEGLLGLSPAAPDLGARAWFGWGIGCRSD